jgi:hypothetical protein
MPLLCCCLRRVAHIRHLLANVGTGKPPPAYAAFVPAVSSSLPSCASSMHLSPNYAEGIRNTGLMHLPEFISAIASSICLKS